MPHQFRAPSAGSILRNRGLWVVAGLVVAISSLHAFQTPWREYPAIEYNDFPAPDDAQQPAEWVFARLMYPPAPSARFDRAGSRWAEGYSSWTQDYPRADRHFLTALRRLTFVNARSVEQAVNLDEGDDVFNYPFLYAVRPGEWRLTDEQAAKFKEFIDRGGFFFTDDFWGTYEWDVFMESLDKVFPGAEVLDIPDDDQFFHMMYDLSADKRYQIPGAWGIRGRFGGRRGGRNGCVNAEGYGCQNDGDTPYWRAIYDDRHRIIAAIIPNSDLGDSWEYADDPSYPEMFSRLGLRLGINGVVYALTH